MRNFQCIGIIKQFNIDKPGNIMTTNEVIEFLNSHGLPVESFERNYKCSTESRYWKMDIR